jgi:hypothetical protein
MINTCGIKSTPVCVRYRRCRPDSGLVRHDQHVWDQVHPPDFISAIQGTAPVLSRQESGSPNPYGAVRERTFAKQHSLSNTSGS